MLRSIGATKNVARFMMVNDGVDNLSKIQQLNQDTIALFNKTCRKNLPPGATVSTRFILDLEEAAFKLTHIVKHVSCPIDPADINHNWCRLMIDQMALEEGWDNEPAPELYPNQALLWSNQVK